MSDLPFLSDDSVRNRTIDLFCGEISKLNCDTLVASQSADIALASPIANRLAMPLVYLDTDEKVGGELSSTQGLYGKSVVLILVRVEEMKKIVTTVMKVRSNGAYLQNAILLAEPDQELQRRLKKLGISWVRVAT